LSNVSKSSELAILLRRILADIDVPRPATTSTIPFAGYDPMDGSESFASSAYDAARQETSRAPPSLSLLEPLFLSYELNPVNPRAQGMVAPPESLDLDSWIVPGGGLSAADEDASDDELKGVGLEVDEYGRSKFPEIAETPGMDGGRGGAGKKKKKKGTAKAKKGKGRIVGEDEMDGSERARVSFRDNPFFSGPKEY
jgi:AP-3 complex subunit delta-1